MTENNRKAIRKRSWQTIKTGNIIQWNVWKDNNFYSRRHVLRVTCLWKSWVINKNFADLQRLPLTRALEWSFLSVETWVFVVVNQLFPWFSHVLSQRRFPRRWMKGEDLREFRMTTASLILFISLRWRITLLKQRGLCELNKIAEILSIDNGKVFRLFD